MNTFEMIEKRDRIRSLKRHQLEEVAQMRNHLRKEPDLVWLFFELTNQCNLHCAHCGSRCEGTGTTLSKDVVQKALKNVDPTHTMVALTGGEPMLHPQFWEITKAIAEAGFGWGMTSNATLIDNDTAIQLKRCGMRTISVSIDGMEEAHDRLRMRKGAWRRTVEGVRSLQRAGFEPDITTVVHKGNTNDLVVLQQLLESEGICSWRIVNVDPIGRACDNKEILLSPLEYTQLIEKIKEKRFHSNMHISYGCAHYLGIDMERMVRDEYFFCGAGITVASIRSNGDICGCLDIEPHPSTVQGNIYKDDFMPIWQNRFELFRRDRTRDCDECRSCSEREVCGGDAFHTWSIEEKRPLWCGHKLLQQVEANMEL